MILGTLKRLSHRLGVSPQPKLQRLSDDLVHAQVVLCLCISLLLASFIAAFVTACKRRNKSSLTLADLSPYMRALMFFIAPTRVAWPAHYVRAARKATISRSKQIVIDLNDLFGDICAGKIELRQPDDLVDLLRGELRVDGWRFLVQVDSVHCRHVQRWLFAESVKVQRIDAGAALRPEQPHVWTLQLDSVPPYLLESCLVRNLSFRYACFLEFTTVSMNLTPWSLAWILSSVPFCPHRHKSRCMLSGPSTTPLFATLHATLEVLARANAKISATHKMSANKMSADARTSTNKPDSGTKTVHAVTNISAAHASTLLAQRDRLHSDTSLRTSYIARYGIECWRERRLIMAWEAALLRAGMLERWSVELRG
ncbi:hypothetical protein BD626DRAFT_418399 [Schizophyllum amplum]|uniref:Uncharacterized protein n=1 Tax=Schizophyllum amplum TaxID=97359 RepID=A0A550BS31_9AGAR|nr:hypothetical protein BD626DRAFT_418399 [Auriculariopsis ampla]